MSAQPGPARTRITQGLARRFARWVPSVFAARLRDPVFVVGFNNCGKSTVVSLLGHRPDLLVYPDEGNDELWFPGFFPWIASSLSIGPIWTDQERFLTETAWARRDAFLHARAQLGAYQLLNPRPIIVQDSGMLAAIALDILAQFPDARFVHFVRDGHISSYITARLEWSRIIRAPGRYLECGCPLEFSSVLERMASYWAWTMRRMRAVAAEAPGRVLELRYENWWQRPQSAVHDIERFLGLPQSRFPEEFRPREDLTPLIMTEMTAAELDIIEKAAGDVLSETGYSKPAQSFHRPSADPEA